jgi:hypothetical protein
MGKQAGHPTFRGIDGGACASVCTVRNQIFIGDTWTHASCSPEFKDPDSLEILGRELLAVLD